MLGRRAGLGGVRHDRLAGVGWQLEHVVVESEVADRWVVERLDAAAGGRTGSRNAGASLRLAMPRSLPRPALRRESLPVPVLAGTPSLQ